MKPISAIDAIAPAFRRTRLVLAGPFRAGFFLKLVVAATLSASNLIAMGILLPMQASNLLFQFLMAGRGASSHGPFPLPHLPAANFGLALFLLFGIGALVAMAVLALLFYLSTRLRLVIFDAVLLGERKFSRAWSKYGTQTGRYYGLSILIALACMLMATLVASPIILISLRMLGSAASDSGNTPGPFLGYVLVSMMVQYLLLFVAIVVDGWAHDFLMPAMAIEDASIEGSFGRFMALVREDPAAIFVYTLLRFALRMGLTILLFIITLLPVVIAGVALFGAGAILYHLLWSAGLGGQVVFGAYAVIAAIVTFVLYFVAIFTASGIVAVFTQAYALIFYAARYPQLRDLLDPPPPAAVEIFPEANMANMPEIESPPDTPPSFLPEPPALW